MAQTAVSLATLGVEDPELRSSARRPVAAPGDERLRPLPDHVATEPDPAAPPELQAEPRGFRHRGCEAGCQAGRLEGDEEGLGSTGETGQPAQPLGHLGRRRARVRPRREIQHEDVDRATGEEHPGDRQALVEGLGGQDDEPVQPNAAGGGLDRIERPGEVEPGNDRAVRLGLGDEPQGERRGTRRRAAAEGDAGAARESARPEDRIERREAGPDDPLDASSGLARGRGSELGWVIERFVRERRRGQRPDHPRRVGRPRGIEHPRSRRAPSRLEGRQSSRHVRGEGGHRTVRLEHLFYSDKPCRARGFDGRSSRRP